MFQSARTTGTDQPTAVAGLETNCGKTTERCRLAVYQLVHDQVARVFAEASKISGSECGVAAPFASARANFLATYQNLEAVAGPRFCGEKKRILHLYAQCPEHGAVVCYDQLGPLELRPVAGMCWAAQRKPQRHRATYSRKQGTEQLHGFYDVHADCLAGRVRKHKTAKDIEACFAKLRSAYPGPIRIYVVMDNLSANVRAARDFFPGHNMEAVYTPTEASWLNAIESEFTALHAYTIKNSDDPNPSVRRHRIYRYIRWRNRKHESSKSYLTRCMR